MTSNVKLVAKDLINKLNDIADFGGRVAMTLGGTESDPTLSQMETPYAWVVLESSPSTSENRERWTQARWNFGVFIAFDYGGEEDDFIDNKLPLIEQVCQAVTGTQVDALSPRRILWTNDGTSLAELQPDKIIYRVGFSVVTYYTQST